MTYESKTLYEVQYFILLYMLQSHNEPLGVPCIAQGYFNVCQGGTGNWTTNPVVFGWLLYQLSSCGLVGKAVITEIDCDSTLNQNRGDLGWATWCLEYNRAGDPNRNPLSVTKPLRWAAKLQLMGSLGGQWRRLNPSEGQAESQRW